MKFKFNPEYLPLLFFVLIIGLIVFGIIYSSAIKRNIFCSGPFVFLPTCDLSMLILPKLNEPNGSICQSDKQCNGYKYGTKCCKGVCTKTGCNSCNRFCDVDKIVDAHPIDAPNSVRKYHNSVCGRRIGQSCVLDEDCQGVKSAVIFFANIPPAAALESTVCCAGVCQRYKDLEGGDSLAFPKSCLNTCKKTPNECFKYKCRI